MQTSDEVVWRKCQAVTALWFTDQTETKWLKRMWFVSGSSSQVRLIMSLTEQMKRVKTQSHWFVCQRKQRARAQKGKQQAEETKSDQLSHVNLESVIFFLLIYLFFVFFFCSTNLKFPTLWTTHPNTFCLAFEHCNYILSEHSPNNWQGMLHSFRQAERAAAVSSSRLR